MSEVPPDLTCAICEEPTDRTVTEEFPNLPTQIVALCAECDQHSDAERADSE